MVFYAYILWYSWLNIPVVIFMECSIRLTIFDAAKRVISASQQEFQRLLVLRREQIAKSQL